MPRTERGSFLSSLPLIGGLTPPALPGLVFRRPGSGRALPFSSLFLVWFSWSHFGGLCLQNEVPKPTKNHTKNL